MFAEAQIDNTDRLIKIMDSYGVTHAVIQPVPGNTSIELVANAAKKHKGRLFPLYRPVAFMNATAVGTPLLTQKRWPRTRTTWPRISRNGSLHSD